MHTNTIKICNLLVQNAIWNSGLSKPIYVHENTIKSQLIDEKKGGD